MKVESVGIVMKKNIDLNILLKIRDILIENNVKIYIEDRQLDNVLSDCKYVNETEFYRNSEIIISLGGDGTLIAAARNAALYNKPVAGINLGHLGFLSEMERDDLSNLIKIINKEYIIDERMMLNCVMTDINGKRREYDCLNDVVISRGSYPRMIEFELSASGSVVDDFISDGMIFSTPTGSTAYSLSAGGPVAEPTLDIIIATPVCAHSFINKSVIFGSDKELAVSINEKYSKNAFVSPDGQQLIEVQGKIYIKKSQYVTKLLRINDKGFYSILKDKMSERGRI